jgi:hypothetical protein
MTLKLPEPVAWQLTIRQFGLDGEEWDTTELRTYKWDEDCIPLHTEDQFKQGQRDALEAAAQLCEAKSKEYLGRDVRNQHSHGAGLGASICADTIRNMAKEIV